MGEIIKINTPFLINEYQIKIKDSSLKDLFPNIKDSLIIIPNLFYDIKEGIKIAFEQLEFSLKSIEESNIYFLSEDNLFFSLEDLFRIKRKLKIKTEMSTQYTEDKNEFIILHINALRMLDCLEYFLKRSKKNDRLENFTKITKNMIILNLKCSALIENEMECNYKEILH